MCVTLSLHPASDPPPELQSTPEPLEGPASNPDPDPATLVLEPVSPPSAPPDLGQAPTPLSAPGPAPELEPAGLPAPSPGAHNPGAVTTKPLVREEKCNILTFPPRLVAKQLTGMDVVSSGPIRMGGDKPSLYCQCPHLPVPDPQSCDLDPNHSINTYHLWVLGDSVNAQAFAVHLWTVAVDTHRACCTECSITQKAGWVLALHVRREAHCGLPRTRVGHPLAHEAQEPQP